jgi:hypothetical protein
MRSLGRVVVVILVAGATFSAWAGDFDGSKLLICAPVEALDCEAGEACAKSTPAEIGAPAFVRIDFAQKALVGPKHTSPIQVLEKTDQQVLIQGTELGFGWTLALDQETGSLAITLANRDGVFVLFGSCTAP